LNFVSVIIGFSIKLHIHIRITSIFTCALLGAKPEVRGGALRYKPESRGFNSR